MTPKRMHTILLCILGLLIAVTIGGLYFANQRLTSIANETARLSAEIEVSNKQIDTYTLTKIKVDSLDYVGELAGKVLPEDKEQSVVVAELSQFALRANLTVAGIEFADPASSSSGDKKKSTIPKGVEVIPIVVKFNNARYEDLLEFLRTVENNRRKMQINNINLQPDEDDRTILSEVSVAINLYAKKPADSEKKQ